ncbi:DUF2141 domain-containing protein [Lutibacter holmesii]|uniref:DUF2141 domain-containing protein n=1 Tax=Lutibacter holmesii TaxID=1137985 RepID=A0ABW3WMD2_9FLAO
MQHLILTVAFLITTAVFGQTSQKKAFKSNATIKVSVTNALSDNGTISFALYNEEGFLKAPLFRASAVISNRQSSVEFENIPAGNYSVVCFHDENSNGKMDFELNGMPKESYGASNNVMNFGPPQFEDSKFEVKNENVTLEIKF